VVERWFDARAMELCTVMVAVGIAIHEGLHIFHTVPLLFVLYSAHSSTILRKTLRISSIVNMRLNTLASSPKHAPVCESQ